VIHQPVPVVLQCSLNAWLVVFNNRFIRYMGANGWIRWVKNKYESKKSSNTQAHTYKDTTTASDAESVNLRRSAPTYGKRRFATMRYTNPRTLLLLLYSVARQKSSVFMSSVIELSSQILNSGGSSLLQLQ